MAEYEHLRSCHRRIRTRHQSVPTAEQLHARALALFDDPEQAVVLLAEARDLDPSSGPIALDRVARLLELCRYGEAEAELRHASLLLPESPGRTTI